MLMTTINVALLKLKNKQLIGYLTSSSQEARN